MISDRQPIDNTQREDGSPQHQPILTAAPSTQLMTQAPTTLISTQIAVNPSPSSQHSSSSPRVAIGTPLSNSAVVPQTDLRQDQTPQLETNLQPTKADSLSDNTITGNQNVFQETTVDRRESSMQQLQELQSIPLEPKEVQLQFQTENQIFEKTVESVDKKLQEKPQAQQIRREDPPGWSTGAKSTSKFNWLDNVEYDGKQQHDAVPLQVPAPKPSDNYTPVVPSNLIEEARQRQRHRNREDQENEIRIEQQARRAPPTQRQRQQQRRRRRHQVKRSGVSDIQTINSNTSGSITIGHDWVPPPSAYKTRDAVGRFQRPEVREVYKSTVPSYSWSIVDPNQHNNRESRARSTIERSWVPMAPSSHTENTLKATSESSVSTGDVFEEEVTLHGGEESVDEEIFEEIIEEEIEEVTVNEESFTEEETIVEEVYTEGKPYPSASSISLSFHTNPSSENGKETKAARRGYKRTPSLVSSSSMSSGVSGSSSSDSHSRVHSSSDSRSTNNNTSTSASSTIQENYRHVTFGSARSIGSTNFTTDSGTKIIYVNNDEELKDALAGCEGEVWIEDDPEIAEDLAGMFVPSQDILVLLIVLVVLLVAGVGVGIFFLI